MKKFKRKKERERARAKKIVERKRFIFALFILTLEKFFSVCGGLKCTLLNVRVCMHDV